MIWRHKIAGEMLLTFGHGTATAERITELLRNADVAGLVDIPVIAAPTSIGYGANFGGLAALLGMLTSCGSGVTVVNIDNGFGAAWAADAILRLTARGEEPPA